MPLNDNQKRHLLSSFRYVDGLLSDIEALLASTGTESPFSQYIQDITPVQRKAIVEGIARLRAQMAAALKKMGIALPAPTISGAWAVQSMLLNVDIALVEIGPRYMRGYGEVDPEAERMLRGVVAELEKTLQRLSIYLTEGSDQRS
ncbi:MAG: hypothetical protein A3F84_06050 [Candidatus Handelsmanbacteria bacterium RIFCSPLOWO2_12_FULL_64_10]|uniref:Uncharacterized protein n=1 Tax=Handelsmanbacteria sp. (strain RIFCSPLOWO2_12_FULL_64_10) TaxID=1817868 RepID=A0A1F6D235_HANXR|nr:MAG: hypothetical protein A3F84_06050 [Candidatus Handelsmanbacteria bacterium RIFCSPLOWO2_12_FULL_64_10]